MLTRLNLSRRLWAGFGLVLGLLLLITLVALQRMQQMGEQTRRIVEVHNQRVAAVQAMMNASNDARLLVRSNRSWRAHQADNVESASFRSSSRYEAP